MHKFYLFCYAVLSISTFRANIVILILLLLRCVYIVQNIEDYSTLHHIVI